jgi:hypothetical protein
MWASSSAATSTEPPAAATEAAPETWASSALPIEFCANEPPAAKFSAPLPPSEIATMSAFVSARISTDPPPTLVSAPSTYAVTVSEISFSAIAAPIAAPLPVTIATPPLTAAMSVSS